MLLSELKNLIDINRLSRNYFDNPIKLQTSKRNQIHPTKEDIEYLYLELNLTVYDCCNIFNIGKSTFKRLIREYNISKERYLIQQNIQKGNERKYGVKFYSKTKEYNDKVKNTSKQKYGKDYYTQTNEYKNRVIKTRSKTRNSIKESKWLDFLNIPNENRNVYLEDLFYNVDGYDKEHKIVYEFLGDFWHGNPRIYPNNILALKRYIKTYNRFRILKENGYRIIYCWEHDFHIGENLMREFIDKIEY